MSALLFPMRKKQYWKAMGSRIRHDPEHMYEVWVEIARPASPSDEPFVIQKFPHDYNDEEVLKTVPKFAFPCPDLECKNVDHFTFVFTDLEAKYKFGFCRYATGAETCMCIISCLPWYEIFYRLLNLCADVINRHSDNVVYPLLTALYQHSLPTQPDQTINIVARGATESFTFVTPDPGLLPTIPENRNLTEYYIAVDPNNMMIIFASILYERRILVTSRKMSRLTACVHGSAALIYPMQWQHLYIPILPAHLLDYCSAPMPFIIGLHSSLLQKAESSMDLGDVVILDADNNKVTTPYDDLQTLPSDTVSLLKKRLRSLQADKISSQAEMHGDALARAFLKALVALIGGYRDALKFREGEQITFDREAFVQSRPASMHQFLEKILHLQIFEEFINDRLELLNSGVGFSDEFELEANDWESDSAGKYNHWLSSMKKQGKKLKREGMEKFDGLKRKANPAMKSAVKNVKDKSKRAYKDLKSKFDDIKKPTSRGMSPGRPSTILITDPGNRTQPIHYKLMSLDDIAINGSRLSDSDPDRLDPKRLSFRLLDDPDIQSALKKSYSAEDFFRKGREPSLAESESLSESSNSSGHAHPSPLPSRNEAVAQSANQNLEPPPRPPKPMVRQSLVAPHKVTLAPPIPAPRRSRLHVQNPESTDQTSHLVTLLDQVDLDQKGNPEQKCNPDTGASFENRSTFGNKSKPDDDDEPELRSSHLARSQAFRRSNSERATAQFSFMDQFDPLTGGQDNKTMNVSNEDEDLLKDWSLDFSFLNNSIKKPPQPQFRTFCPQSAGNGSVPPRLTSFQPRATTLPRETTQATTQPTSTMTQSDFFNDLCDVKQFRCDLNVQKWEKFE